MPTANREAIALHRASLRHAKQQFQALSDEMREAALNATTTTAQEVARVAQARIKASPSWRTGLLHDHIQWHVRKTSGLGRVGVSSGQTRIGTIKVKGIVIAGRGGSALRSQGARVVRPSRYAHLVEFGTERSKKEEFMGPAAASQKAPHLARLRANGIAAARQVSRSAGGVGML